MKGTAPRDADPARDAELVEELRASDKGRAENLMIVDLLRNDISRIAQVGSVKVPLLFAVESYATLHQMISRVVGCLTERPSIERLMAALFPCGSITGAPKIRAMEIIRGGKLLFCGDPDAVIGAGRWHRTERGERGRARFDLRG
jgi:para-aminobenzoate synthetase component 1